MDAFELAIDEAIDFNTQRPKLLKERADFMAYMFSDIRNALQVQHQGCEAYSIIRPRTGGDLDAVDFRARGLRGAVPHRELGRSRSEAELFARAAACSRKFRSLSSRPRRRAGDGWRQIVPALVDKPPKRACNHVVSLGQLLSGFIEVAPKRRVRRYYPIAAEAGAASVCSHRRIEASADIGS
jgi:hypothetical protein